MRMTGCGMCLPFTQDEGEEQVRGVAKRGEEYYTADDSTKKDDGILELSSTSFENNVTSGLQKLDAIREHSHENKSSLSEDSDEQPVSSSESTESSKAPKQSDVKSPKKSDSVGPTSPVGKPKQQQREQSLDHDEEKKEDYEGNGEGGLDSFFAQMNNNSKINTPTSSDEVAPPTPSKDEAINDLPQKPEEATTKAPVTVPTVNTEDEEEEELEDLVGEVLQDVEALKYLEERDFDKDPTELYLFLMRKEWNNAVSRIFNYPNEARTWVSRKELDGETLRWRLLPIHAAIVFSAPELVLDALILSFPEGAVARDDQGMLPVHLSIRMGSPQPIINKLLKAAPEALAVKDKKGRTPRKLAEKSRGALKEMCLEALENAPKTQEQIRVEIITEQQLICDQKIKEIQSVHATEIDKMKSELAAQTALLTAQIGELQQERKKDAERYNFVVDQIKEAEEALNAKNDAELELVKQTQLLEKENDQLKREINTFENALNLSEQNQLRMKSKVEEVRQAGNAKVVEFEAKERQLQGKIEELEKELQRRTESEQALAWQVSALADKLGVKDDYCPSVDASSTGSYSEEADDSRKPKLSKPESDQIIRALEMEREELRATVNKLSIKLYKVVGFLDEMVHEQENIVKEALKRDAESKGQEQGSTKSNGDGNKEAAEQLLDAVPATERQKLVENVSGMKNQIIGVIDSVIESMPKSHSVSSSEDYDDDFSNNTEDV